MNRYLLIFWLVFFAGCKDAQRNQGLESLPIGSKKDMAIAFCGNPDCVAKPLPNVSCYYYSTYGDAFADDLHYELIFINDTLSGILMGKQKIK